MARAAGAPELAVCKPVAPAGYVHSMNPRTSLLARTTSSRAGLGLAVCFCALAAACTSLLEPDERRAMGLLFDPELGFEESAVELPATVTAGEAFTVTIRTWWPSGSARKGVVEVQSRAMAATLTPYDFVRGSGRYGLAAVQRFTHTARLIFWSPGVARVRVRGRAWRSNDVWTIERSVEVR